MIATHFLCLFAAQPVMLVPDSGVSLASSGVAVIAMTVIDANGLPVLAVRSPAAVLPVPGQ